MKDVYTAFEKPEYFWNRELSWIRFDERILEEAQDTTIPLFERMKFLSITSSNLDEFYMVRVASLKDQVHTGYAKRDIAGMTPKEQLAAISEANHKLVADQYKTFRDSLIPALAVAGLRIYKCHEELSDAQKSYIDAYFDSNVYPVLTPMAMDSSRPFPLIRNKSLNIGALIKKKGSDDQRTSFATVQVPSVLPRFIELPETEEGITSMILMDEIIERNLEKLFLGYEVVCAHPYRIMRNAELGIDEEEAADLLVEIQKSLRKRQWGEVIRLEVEEGIESELLRILKKEFYVREDDIFYINGPLDLTFLMKLYGTKGFDDYKEPSYTPAEVPELQNDDDIFANIRKGDIFLHHPYMSFSPVVDFVRTAATDPNVLAIKQTLYRVSGNSPIIAALAQAAENGKQVTALVELKARFDEENNIVWAQKLEKAGCHVIYGLVGLKTHSKITLVVRKEEDGIRRYVHLGTGNYNDSTAKLYTDCGILTCDERIGEDASAAFNMISGYSEPDRWNCLLVAPIWMRERFLHLIRMEQKHAEEGRKALIVAKMNSLCDREIIAALYKASAAGVKISLIVRGICCLKTGIPGISDNITVRSLVGNFLEHARIFYFYANGAEEVYMGSADWMPRNLDKRVEIVFPLTDQHCKDEAIRILQIQLSDNIKARTLQSDGSYIKLPPESDIRICAQDYFCEYAQKKAKEREESEDKRVFIPAEPVNE
uniref:Polyphosphate kinase n=1 Tax=Eubacterium cellulosolvens (strain ATCC 43171 / JCM 9499 / 6) TaxID=633697 RepID=I5AQZ7_EUBC6